MLSNFFVPRLYGVPLFKLDGYHWYSVEHYFHAQKFRLSHPKFCSEFAWESGSELSRSFGPVVKKAGRRYPMTSEEVLLWNEGGSRAALIRAQEAKFRQNPELKKVLLLTRGAILKHRASRFSPLVNESDLMALREKLAEEEL